MNLIDHKPCAFRLPALIAGDLLMLDAAQLRGRWVALLFLPTYGLLETMFLDQQRQRIQEDGAELLGVAPLKGAYPPFDPAQAASVRTPILMDPLGRLHHRYGVSTDRDFGRCRTFVIDRDGLLRFQLIHDLNGRGLNAVREILSSCRKQDAEAASRPTDESANAMGEVRFAIAPS
ncbi:MAG: redoxin domain-containing protein [Nitrospirales bacterium]